VVIWDQALDAPVDRRISMPKYVIERNIPDVGSLTDEQLVAIARQSCNVLGEMGPSVQWLYSYVTDDQIICTYIAPDEAPLHEHATRGGFPADRVQRIHQIIDPTTAEALVPQEVTS
jgi:hypothetical protein